MRASASSTSPSRPRRRPDPRGGEPRSRRADARSRPLSGRDLLVLRDHRDAALSPLREAPRGTSCRSRGRLLAACGPARSAAVAGFATEAHERRRLGMQVARRLVRRARERPGGARGVPWRGASPSVWSDVLGRRLAPRRPAAGARSRPRGTLEGVERADDPRRSSGTAAARPAPPRARGSARRRSTGSSWRYARGAG